MKRWPQWVALATLVGAVLSFMVRLVQASNAQAPLSYDIYAYFYPVMLQGVRSVLDGGRGLLWNPLQECGQPFFGSGTTGILYPPAVLFFLLSPDHALYAYLFFNMVVGTVGAYLLCCELGVGTTAAWCGALAYGLSNTGIDLITWTPLVSGPYAWLPAAMLYCERILRAPTLRRGVALAVTLSLALIPGHPQLVFYLYQLIVIRFAWELVTNPGAIGRPTVSALALGLALAPLLIAVQLFPALEVMRSSVRSTALSAAEINPSGYLSWHTLRNVMAYRMDLNNPFLLTLWVLASASVLDSPRRRHVLFYGVTGVICFALAMGPDGYLFPLYAKLPLGALFRGPIRFLWITSFCVAVLVAFGVDAMLAERRRSMWASCLGTAAVPLLIGSNYPLLNGLSAREWVLVSIIVVASVTAAAVPRLRGAAGLVLATATVTSLVLLRPMPRHLLPSGDALYARAPVFNALRALMTPNDRVYLVVPNADFSLQQKTGALFGVPAIFDYDSQPTRRYAAFFGMLRTGNLVGGLNSWLYPLGGFLPDGFKRRLLDVTGTRYLVVDASVDRTATVRDPPLPLRAAFGDVRIYENTTALPRARYVPRVQVVRDDSALLQRLATGQDDLRQVAFVEDDPPSGFLGEDGDAGAAATEIVTNDPEHLVLRVHAPKRGFLFLADQYFPGWSATVNGLAAPIARANYAFRLVEVPAGDSLVEMHFAPLSVRIGAVVSLLTCLGMAVLVLATR